MGAPPGSPRRRQGRLVPLSAEHKRKRAEKRKRRKTWVARVWIRQHVQGDRS